jgi:hypothetical protein
MASEASGPLLAGDCLPVSGISCRSNMLADYRHTGSRVAFSLVCGELFKYYNYQGEQESAAYQAE